MTEEEWGTDRTVYTFGWTSWPLTPKFHIRIETLRGQWWSYDYLSDYSFVLITYVNLEVQLVQEIQCLNI